MIRICFTSLFVLLIYSAYSFTPGNISFSNSDGRKGISLESNDWLDDLQRFREALLNGDKEVVKSFFAFPISDPGNDIWFRVNSRLAASFDSRKVTPFKETDFDKYYGELLGVDFKKTFEVLELSKLSNTSSIQGTKLEIIPESRSYMKAYIDKVSKVITLEVLHEGKEFGKFSFKYHFRILNNSAIKFRDMTFVM